MSPILPTTRRGFRLISSFQAIPMADKSGFRVLARHGCLRCRANIRAALSVGNLTLYTNMGIGTIRAPIRINCPPEITLITLRAGKGSGDEERAKQAVQQDR